MHGFIFFSFPFACCVGIRKLSNSSVIKSLAWIRLSLEIGLFLFTIKTGLNWRKHSPLIKKKNCKICVWFELFVLNTRVCEEKSFDLWNTLLSGSFVERNLNKHPKKCACLITQRKTRNPDYCYEQHSSCLDQGGGFRTIEHLFAAVIVTK